MIRILLLTIAALVGITSAALSEIQRFSQVPALQKQANVVQMTIVLEAPISQVWQLIGEGFEDTKWFNVAASTTYFLRGETAKVGSQRRTVGTDGTFIDVEIFRYSKANHTVSWEIIDTDLAPISFGFSEYRLERMSAQKTRLIQISGFKMGNGLMDTAMRFRFPTILKTELSGIKHYVETGEKIEPKTARKLRNNLGAGVLVKRNW